MTQILTSVRASLDHTRDKQHSFREESAARSEVAKRGHGRKLGSEAPRTHVSVMAHEALELLSVKKGEQVVDATAGAGGHSEAILKAAPVRLLALDADPEAAEAVASRLAHFGERARVVNDNFRNIETVLTDEGIETVDKALFDLGWNAAQLASGRGFSFLADEPLLMTYGEKPASGFTARDILNTWEEKVLADVFFGYGEERYARAIAKAVVLRRALQPIETTFELVEIIRDAVPARYRHGRLHFATRTFQALRIAANDELGSIEAGVRGVWKHLSAGGRIVVITFHSIEDRAVKKLFVALAGEGGTRLTKKPLIASDAEIARNPSARSAKMRAIEKAI